jgi:hypothetical protein
LVYNSLCGSKHPRLVRPATLPIGVYHSQNDDDTTENTNEQEAVTPLFGPMAHLGKEVRAKPSHKDSTKKTIPQENRQFLRMLGYSSSPDGDQPYHLKHDHQEQRHQRILMSMSKC